jgi:hypothetical protein
MEKTLKYFFTLLAVTLIISCTSDEGNTSTFIGGKILHPKSDYVLLYNQDKVLDTLKLDENDKFLGEYKDFKGGFYYFKHGPEHQYIYIEPKDSILIRLNTWDFDESLVFTGKGAEKNNILIDCFLESEKEASNHKIYRFYGLEPNLFKFKMDSILKTRQQKIDDFKSKNETLSEEYLHLLDVVAKFPLYNRFEKYPSRYKYVNKEFPKTDTNFYSYRKNINFSNDSLMYLQVYSRYIVNRLYNNAFSKGLKSRTTEFAISLLKDVDKNISKEKMKNTFLREMVINDFLEKSSCDVDKDVFYTYFKLSSDIEDKKQIQRLLNDVKNLHGGNVLPDFKVFDYNNSAKSSLSLLNKKNTVFYVWNLEYISEEYLSSRIRYLSKKFPELNFVGIKIKSKEKNNPIKGLDIKNQFYIDSNSTANEFLTSKLPRTILVDKKGNVLNGYASIHSSLIFKQLKYLQKK